MKPIEAVDKAREYLLELMPELAHRSLQLEEVETFGPNWKITFSALATPISDPTANLAELLRPRRVQKVVILQADDGAFVSVTNPSRAA